jgi:glucose/arabinose dehydrogenase
MSGFRETCEHNGAPATLAVASMNTDRNPSASHFPGRLAVLTCATLALLRPVAQAQVLEQQVYQSIDAHANYPAKLKPTPDLMQQLKVPAGFHIAKFAENLEAPRILAVAPSGDVYVTRRDPLNDVLLLRDADGDGVAEVVRRVARIEHVHGIAFRGGRVYLAAIRKLYVADVLADGSFSEPQVLYSDLPDAGQHPNRTLKFSPSGHLFLSVGSTSNEAPDPNPENATMMEVSVTGGPRTIFAKGLRNTIGFDWEPTTGALWGMDHGIDWLGDLEHREELNRIVRGADYGFPYIYDNQKFNLRRNPEETTGLTWSEYAARTKPPVTGLEPHSAPMEFLFYRASQFPVAYRNQAFLALHGSWNRARPVGYSVVMISFSNGQPTGVKDFVTGFLVQDKRGQFGRPVGLAVAKDGALLISDDSGGDVYRVWYQPVPR